MGDSFSFANPHAHESGNNHEGTPEGLGHGHGSGEGLGHSYGDGYGGSYGSGIGGGSGAPWDPGYLHDGLGPSPDEVIHMAQAEMQRLIGTDGQTTSWLYSDYMQPAGAHEPSAQTPAQPSTNSAPIQRKMTVGSANDPLEEEADAVADRVMRDTSSCYLSKEQIAEIQAKRAAEGPQAHAAPKITRQKGVRTSSGRIVDSSSCYLSKEQIAEIQAKHKAKGAQPDAAPMISRNLAGMDEDAEETLGATHAFEKTEEEDNLGKTTSIYMQREAAASPEGGEASPELQSRIEGVRNSGGSQLPDTERDFFESRMGRDFSDVRIHTGSDAAEVSRDVNAKAFTIGRDVVFGEGEYKPGTDEGRRLMAHELTHTVQQGAAGEHLTREPIDTEPSTENSTQAGAETSEAVLSEEEQAPTHDLTTDPLLQVLEGSTMNIPLPKGANNRMSPDQVSMINKANRIRDPRNPHKGTFERRDVGGGDGSPVQYAFFERSVGTHENGKKIVETIRFLPNGTVRQSIREANMGPLLQSQRLFSGAGDLIGEYTNGRLRSAGTEAEESSAAPVRTWAEYWQLWVDWMDSGSEEGSQPSIPMGLDAIVEARSDLYQYEGEGADPELKARGNATEQKIAQHLDIDNPEMQRWWCVIMAQWAALKAEGADIEDPIDFYVRHAKEKIPWRKDGATNVRGSDAYVNARDLIAKSYSNSDGRLQFTEVKLEGRPLQRYDQLNAFLKSTESLGITLRASNSHSIALIRLSSSDAWTVWDTAGRPTHGSIYNPGGKFEKSVLFNQYGKPKAYDYFISD